jgi:hypothetical protein
MMGCEKVSFTSNKVEACKNQGDAEERGLSSWQLLFQQSKVNNGAYDGERLPTYNWDWPQETWLQKRLRYLRKNNRKYTEPDLRGDAGLPVCLPASTSSF